MLKKKYVVLDNDELEDETLYDSIAEAQETIEGEDFKKDDSVIIYELVPRSEYILPAKSTWKAVK